jgi:hypothetical protein
LRDWNSYLKKLYESPNVVETLSRKEDFFSLEDIEFGVKRLIKGKAMDIEVY